MQNKPGFGQSTTGFGGQGIFGGGTTTGLGGQPTGMFGQNNAAGGSTLFGGQPSQSAFGQNKPTLFGNQQQTTFSQPSGQQTPAFGSGTNIQGNTLGQGFNKPAGTLFGGAQQTPGMGGSIFGGQQTGTAPNFGGGGSNLFGSQQQQNQATPLFGQQNQPQQNQNTAFGVNTSFNAQQPQNQPPGSSIFGAGAQKQQPSSFLGGGQTNSIFGAPQQQQQPSTLFGGGASATPLGGGGSLFGQNTGSTGLTLGASGATIGQPAQNQSSLFGAKPLGTTNQTTSLFGGATSAPTGQPTSSLFGQQSTSGGTSLFGGQLSQPTNTGSSLFGGSAAPSSQFGLTGSQIQPTGSLFSGQSLNTGTSSLFGGASAQNTQGQPSLYGQQQTAGQSAIPGYQQQVPGGIINIYANTDYLNDPYGIKGSFLEKPGPFEDVDKELEALRTEAKRNIGDPIKNPYATITPDNIFTTSSSNMPITNTLYSRVPTTFDWDEEEERQRAKEELRVKQEQKRLRELERQRTTFTAAKGYDIGPGRTDRAFAAPVSRVSLSKTGSYEPLSASRTSERGLLGTNTLRQERIVTESLVQPKIIRNVSERTDKDRQSKLSDQDSYSVRDDDEEGYHGKDVIKVTAILPDNDIERKYLIYIHKSRDVADLYSKVEQWLVENYNFDPKKQNFKLMYKNQILKKTQTLEEAEIQYHTKIYILLEDLEDTNADARKSQTVVRSIDSQSASPPTLEQNLNLGASKRASTQVSVDLLAPKERLPKPPKAGYKTIPDYSDLARMTLRQLEHVKDFTVYNEFGKIQFIGETDVTDVDLADLITIDKQGTEVYDDTRHQKPPVGQKLNKPAIITMFNIKPKSSETPESKEQRLIQSIQSREGEHISYDPLKFTWTFKVPHFTRYNVDDDEDDEAEMIDTSKPAIPSPLYHTQNQDQRSQPLISSRQFIGQNTGYNQYFKSRGEENQRIVMRSDDLLSEDIANSSVISEKIPQPEQPSQSMDFERASQASSYKRRFILKDEEDRYLPIIPQQVIQPRLLTRRDKQTKILSNIKEKENRLKLAKELHEKLPTTSQAIDYLQQFGLKSFKNTSLAQSGGVRPCFRPDGSLLVVQNTTKSVKLQQVPVSKLIKQDHNKLFTEQIHILLKHSDIKAYEIGSSRNINAQLGKMNLNAMQDVEMEDLDLEYQNIGRSQVMNDPFLNDLLQNIKLPILKFKQDPRDLFFFLKDIAQHYDSVIQKVSDNKLLYDSLNHEFYIICLLNALFGNPNIHLVQLHHKYTGFNNFQSAMKIYGQTSEESKANFIDKDTFQIAKKRRSAVTEVIRFICQQEFKIQNNCPLVGATADQIYQTALELMLNGDIKGTVRHLNNHKKHKMALWVSQSVNSVQTREVLKAQMLNHSNLYRGFNKYAMEMVRLMTGEYDITQGNLHWFRALCVSLLFNNEPTQTLKEVIDSFDKKDYNPKSLRQNVDNKTLMYLLLKLYAVNDLPRVIDQLQTFNQVEPTPQTQPGEHRIKWLTMLILQQITKHYKVERYSEQLSQISFSDSSFANISALYINQLLVQHDWRQALIVALFIPHTNVQLKKKIIFEILNQKVLCFINSKENFGFLMNVLKLPASYIYTARATVYEYRFLNEAAMKEWELAGNFDRIHKIFMKRIIPLYFHISYQDSMLQLSLLKNKDLLHKVLQQLNSKSQHIINWAQLGQIVFKFFAVMERIVRVTATPNEIKELSQLVSSSEKLDDIIKKVIKDLLIQWDTSMKVDICKSETVEDSQRSDRPALSVDRMEPLPELIEANTNDEMILRSLEQFTTNNLLWLSSSQVASQRTY